MDENQLQKMQAAKLPDQKLMDNYAKIEKANEQFMLKESGVEKLSAT